MKYFYLFTLFYFVSCSTDTSKEIIESPVYLKTSNRQLKANFESCLHLTQELIKKKISEKEFSKFFHFDNRATGFEYENAVLNVSDTLFQLPKSYHIFYEFIYEGDTISSFRADFDSKIKLIDYSDSHLLAFRQFIDKELTVTKTEAIEIVLNNGMKRQNLNVILKCSKGKFYWECKNDCDGCFILDIDAKTGKIIGQGKTYYRY